MPQLAAGDSLKRTPIYSMEVHYVLVGILSMV